jgi:hypothetical protein
MRIPDELEECGQQSLAVHEAAHAVVAWSVGLEVDFLKLERGWWSGDLIRGFIRIRGNTCEEEAVAEAAVTAAGAIAQERWLIEQGVVPSMAEGIAEYSGGHDAEDIRELTRAYGISESAARAKATTLVDQNWDKICRVGTQLHDRGRLAGRKAK